MDGVKRVMTGLQWIVISGQWPVASGQWSVVGNCWGRWGLVERAIGWRCAQMVALCSRRVGGELEART